MRIVFEEILRLLQFTIENYYKLIILGSTFSSAYAPQILNKALRITPSDSYYQ